MICAIDNTQHETREDLHKHLRKLKVKQEDYYVKYFPRVDLFTKELIPFKNPDQYLAAEFLSKDNLKEWIKAHPFEGRAWAIEWLEKRKKEKELIYPPTQAELRSLLCPSIHYYDKVGGYSTICKELGYKIRFTEYWQDVKLMPGMILVEDTREQLPLNLKDVPTIQRKLNCGDYGLAAPFDCGIYIERKSLSDFVGTLSDRIIERKSGDDSNLARFTRELTRARECGHYIVMLVEDSIENALNFRAILKNVKTSPDHIFKNLRDLLHDFENFQVLFVNNRDAAARAVVQILSAGESIKKMDLQYEFESKHFIP